VPSLRGDVVNPARIGSVASLSILFSLGVGVASAEDAPVAKERTFSFGYRVKVPAPAAGAKRLDVWIPLPIEDEHQKVSDLKVEASVPHEETKDATYGNRMVHVGVDDPTSEVTVGWTATITRKADAGEGKGPVLERYKGADTLVPIEGKATEIAAELGVTGEGDARARAQKIYDSVLSTMAYDKETPGWGKGDFDRACAVGKGNCTDFHAKFMGISRAAKIPARFTMGVSLGPPPKGNPAGYHCWAHFHDGTSWIPIDASEADKIEAKDPAKAKWFFGHLDADRVALSVGRDLELSPRQKGAPLLFFAYPYAEVDGKQVDVAKENRSFEYADK
jgi:transglutaminase-like putative cysteine protease